MVGAFHALHALFDLALDITLNLAQLGFDRLGFAVGFLFQCRDPLLGAGYGTVETGLRRGEFGLDRKSVV